MDFLSTLVTSLIVVAKYLTKATEKEDFVLVQVHHGGKGGGRQLHGHWKLSWDSLHLAGHGTETHGSRTGGQTSRPALSHPLPDSAL